MLMVLYNVIKNVVPLRKEPLVLILLVYVKMDMKNKPPVIEHVSLLVELVLLERRLMTPVEMQHVQMMLTAMERY